MTQINLAAICDQLTEALGMEQPLKVAGLIEDNGELVGWTVVSISENGKMTPISAQYKTIKDLFAAYGE